MLQNYFTHWNKSWDITNCSLQLCNCAIFIFFIEWQNFGSHSKSWCSFWHICQVCKNGNAEEMAKYCYTHAHIYNNWIETGCLIFFSKFQQINFWKKSSIWNQGWVYENGPAGIYSDSAGCGTVFENNVQQIIEIWWCQFLWWRWWWWWWWWYWWC